jgi:hypothetical protein
MDSQLLLNQIRARKQQNLDEISFLDSQLVLAEQGYKTDQERIDSAIQADREAVSKQINDLTVRAETAEAELATLKTKPIEEI